MTNDNDLNLTDRDIIDKLHSSIVLLLDGIARAGQSMRLMLFGVYLLAVSNILLLVAVVWSGLK